MKDLEISHDILLAGPDFDTCRRRVERFFEKTMLIRYDRVRVQVSESFNGVDEEFLPRMYEALAANHQVLTELLENLKEEGFVTLEDLRDLEKGYISKVFHNIAHLLDGFIGIDSRFYNLEEDSHGISRDLQRKIYGAPGNYWIIRVMGRISTAGEDPLDALRTFEWKGKDSE